MHAQKRRIGPTCICYNQTAQKEVCKGDICVAFEESGLMDFDLMNKFFNCIHLSDLLFYKIAEKYTLLN